MVNNEKREAYILKGTFALCFVVLTALCFVLFWPQKNLHNPTQLKIRSGIPLSELAQEMKNDSLISNLPANCCVEVPCDINSDGYTPTKIGNLPEQLAALMRTNINVQILTAEAATSNKKEHIYHAALLDPLTSSILSIDEIYSMTNKLLDAHKDYLPKYS